MVFPLMLLALGAIFVGFISRDMFIGLGNSFFGNCNTVNISNYNLIDSEFLPSVIKNIPFLLTISGITLSLLLINCFNISKTSVFTAKLSKIYRMIYTILTQK
jgi:NADH-ubiquinone oxidoreductase chain 5